MSAPAIVDPSDTLAVLRAAESWLSDKAHWTQFTFWRDANRQVTREREEVCQTCADGAFSYVTGRDPTDRPCGALDEVRNELGGWAPPHVNDGPDGYNRIMAGLRRAIEKLEAERA